MSQSERELLDNLKSLGYQPDHEMTLYGEHVKVVSDPFQHEGEMAVEVRCRESNSTRVLRIPRMTVLAAERHQRRAA